MEFNEENFTKLLLLSNAVDEWSCERTPKDPGECDLMIAIWRRDGDRTEPCPECDGECGEPCAPITADRAITGLSSLKVRLQLAFRKKHKIKYVPPVYVGESS